MTPRPRLRLFASLALPACCAVLRAQALQLPGGLSQATGSIASFNPPFTVEAAVFPEPQGSGAVGTVFRLDDLALPNSLTFAVQLVENASGTFNPRLTWRSTLTGSVPVTATALTVQIPALQASHLTVTYSESPTLATIRFYANGVLAQTVSGLGNMVRPATGATALVGSGRLSEPFRGRLDAVRLWTVERPAADIARDWQLEFAQAPALRASFRFDGTPGDPDNGITLAFQNGAAYGPEFMPYGSALDLPLTNGAAVVVPDAPALSPSGAMTVEVWCVPGSTQAFEPALVRKGAAVGQGYRLALTGPPPQIPRFEVETSAGLRGVTGTAVTPGVPVHLAGTYDQSFLRMYVNGVLTRSVAVTPAPLVANTSELRMGRGDGATPDGFQGSLDAVRLWSTARTGAQIAAARNRTAVAGPGLVASWDFTLGNLESSPPGLPATGIGAVGFRGDLVPLQQALAITTGRAEVPPQAAFFPATGLTVEAWVQADPAAGQTLPMLVGTGTNPSWALRLNGFSGSYRPEFAVRTSGGAFTVTAPTAVQRLTPTHLAATYDGGQLRLFVDGNAVAQTPATGVLLNNNSALRIGQGDPAFPEQFAGVLDNVRLWSLARSQDAIRAAMRLELPPSPGLIASYACTGNYQDGSGNGFHATPVPGVLGFVAEFITLYNAPAGLVSTFGTPASGPRIAVCAPPVVGGYYAIGNTGAPANGAGLGILAVERVAAAIPVAGAEVWFNPFLPFLVVPLAAGPLGSAEWGFVVPGPAGVRSYYQFFWVNPANPSLLISSEAADVVSG